MREGLDVAAALGEGVRDAGHAWDFVRRFAEEWVGVPLRAADGCTEAELGAVEAELGFKLPAVLREGYALFGRRDDLTRSQDPLIAPSGLRVDDGLGGVLVFREENQACASWGIPRDRIEQDDPPVVVESHQGWMPFLDRMSVAWVELVLSESLLGGAGCYDACELPDALLPSLYDRYARVPLPDHPLWASAEDSPLRWYAAPGRLIRRDGDGEFSWVHAGGRTAADLSVIRADLPTAWVC